MRFAALLQRLREKPVLVGLLCVTAVALVARLIFLGHRVFYYDEVWFGYWILKFLEHGDWTYRPILHGPFYVRLNSIVFPLLGANDYTARLVPAVIGGLLPLSAWLFRDRLRQGEVLAMGILLAGNPILLYYSRFMRKDLPLAALMLVTLGFLVRANETGRLRYVYGGAMTFGWALTTKESVLLWVLTWAGAAALVLDRQLLRAQDTTGDPRTVLRELLTRGRGSITYWGVHLAGAGLTTLLVVIYAYAPRAGEVREVGLWEALGGQYGQLPTVMNAATAGALRKAIDYWVAGDIQQHPYLPYLQDTLATLATGALGVCVLAVVGFFWDRYGQATPRSLVGFNAYAGGAAILGYPLANNLPVPWSTVHAVVPLTIPAAVGAAALYRWARGQSDPLLQVDPFSDIPWREIRAGVVAIVILVLAVNAGVVGLQTSYLEPHESPRGDPGNEIVYYAQPPGELRDPIHTIFRAAATGGSDVDILYVGNPLTDSTPPPDQIAPSTPYNYRYPLIHGRIPLPWYTELADADLADVPGAADIGANPPPIVITTPTRRELVRDQLGAAYEGTYYPLDDIGDRAIVVFVHHELQAPS